MVKLDTLQKIVGPGLVAVIRAASAALEDGADIVKVGGELTKGAADDFDAISVRARQLLAAIRKAREA